MPITFNGSWSGVSKTSGTTVQIAGNIASQPGDTLIVKERFF